MRIYGVFLSILLMTGTAWGQLYKPSSLVATGVSSSSIKLTWKDTSINESGYLIERSPNSSSGFVKIGSVGTGMSTYTDSNGLTSLTYYYYRIRAYNRSSSGVYSYSPYSSVAAGRTLSKYSSPPEGAINVRSYGATPNDSSDDTAEIQKAIDATPYNGTVWVPAGKYLVNGVATTSTSGPFLKLKSNMRFMMDPAAVLQIIPNSSIRYYGLSTNGADNIEISGGTIVGERYQHTYTAGSTHEWGMCIGVKEGSSNVKIHDITVKDCTGDGIVTGGQSHGILIERVVSTNNRRQGLSLTNSYDVIVRNSEFSYTNGTSPEAGIDIEPDLPREARNILIENNKIHHNAKVGVLPYIQSYDLQILNNEISYNNLGIYVRGSQGGEIRGNTIKHNRNLGLRFENQLSGEIATTGYTVSNNKFINNSTNTVGLNDGTGALTTITGVGTGTIFTWQVQILSSCCYVKPSILTNYYAK